MESTSWGGKALDALVWFRQHYYNHVDRYHAWNAARYRFFTRLVAAAVLLMALAALAGAVWAGCVFTGTPEKCGASGRRRRFCRAAIIATPP